LRDIPNQRVYFGGSVGLVPMRAGVEGERTVRVFWSSCLGNGLLFVLSTYLHTFTRNRGCVYMVLTSAHIFGEGLGLGYRREGHEEGGVIVPVSFLFQCFSAK
jgi:hypothetical protein